MCIESSPEDSTEDQPIAKELCVLMAQEPNAHHLVCECVCRPLGCPFITCCGVCIRRGPCVGVVQPWVDDQRAAYRCHLHLVHIVSTPSNTPPAPPAAQVTSLVATVPREATARSGKNDTEDDVRYLRGSFTGHLQLLTVTVWLDLLYWRYSVQQGMDPPAVLKVKVEAFPAHQPST